MSTLKASNIQPQSDSDPLIVSTNATERLRIDTTGKFGIGTASPGSALEVKSFVSSATTEGITGTVANAGILLDVDFQATTATRYSSGLFWRDSALGSLPLAGIWAGDENSNGTSLLFGTSQTYGNGINKIGLSIRNGSVGIGTTGPGSQLHLYGTAPIIRLQDSDDGGAYSQINSNSAGGQAGSLILEADKTNVNSSSYFRIDIGGSEKVRIDHDGLVGIGTSSPTVALDVAGAINVSNFTNSNVSPKPTASTGVAGQFVKIYRGSSGNPSTVTLQSINAACDAGTWWVFGFEIGDAGGLSNSFAGIGAYNAAMSTFGVVATNSTTRLGGWAIRIA